MSTIKCSKCGAEIPAGSKFCMECGNKIESQDNKKDKIYKPRAMHYAYGNNQSCAGKSDIVVRNGFVYFISKSEDAFEIKVSPLSDNDMCQTLYLCKGPESTASCLNMVEDELIFYEYCNGHKISALNVYTGEKRIILEEHKSDSIWIENGCLSFIEDSKLYSININGEEYHETILPFNLKDRIFGYNGKIYAIRNDNSEVVEISDNGKHRSMDFTAGIDMIYGIIGNLYYSPEKDSHGDVLLCKNLESLEITNGVQDIDRMITAFEQYVIFSRNDEKNFSFAWNIQTLRVYRLNRYISLKPYSFTQILSDYILIENEGNLYKIPAPVFFQSDEPMFDADKYLFAVI